MTINGDPFRVLSERDPTKLPWKELGVDYVIESTGKFRRLSELQGHLDAGARRVLITVPTKDDLESTVVLGVNDHVVTKDARIVSNASCTTNCAAPLAKVLHGYLRRRAGPPDYRPRLHRRPAPRRCARTETSADLVTPRSTSSRLPPGLPKPSGE